MMHYVIDYETDNKEVNVLDVTIRNNLSYSCDFTVYRKPTIMNVQIKPLLPKHSYGSI